jgi:protein involved in polysaccharide export with SLBB domain
MKCEVRRYQHNGSARKALLLAALFGLCWSSACHQDTPDSSWIRKTRYRLDEAKLSDTDRLQALRAERERDTFADKFAIGPGDLIEVTVPRVVELNKFRVRVSEDNSISVPLAGVLSVGGMTEQELRQALYDRLAKPMKNPDVEVFVVQYESRNVAVVGMVRKAGLYSITNRADTVLTMINRAGGMDQQASLRVFFIPFSRSLNYGPLAAATSLSAPSIGGPGRVQTISANPGEIQTEASDGVSADPGQADSSRVSQNHLLPLLGATDPIEISLTTARSESELDVPVRPGDTIIVPAAGEVMVDGWVRNPGAFHIVPGMTAVSAVSAAGGALFSDTAEVLRINTDGTRRSIPISLSKVTAGEEPDVLVQEGDVVVVEHSPTGAVPYLLYEMFTKFGTGMYLPVP